MTKKILITTGVLVMMLVLGVGVIYAQGGRGNGRGHGAGGRGAGWQSGMGQGMMNCDGICQNLETQLPPAVEGELSQDVIDAMTAGWLDEYNAYMTYQAIIDQFGNVRPFTNIQRAEEQHMAAWEFLFDRYGVELPTVSDEIEPLEVATISEACQIAADAEIANFGLYDKMLEALQDYPDMVQVVTALRDASEYRHLPAFENCALR